MLLGQNTYIQRREGSKAKWPYQEASLLGEGKVAKCP